LIATPALKYFQGFINNIETVPATIPFNLAATGDLEAQNIKLTIKFVTDKIVSSISILIKISIFR
jgi:hypothetical protein